MDIEQIQSNARHRGGRSFLPDIRSFLRPPHKKEETMFDKTKAKVETQLNDRVAAPIRTSVLISCAAFCIALVALLIVVGKR